MSLELRKVSKEVSVEMIISIIVSVGANMQLYNNGRLKKSAEKSQYDLEAVC